ncbi:hypothetical protein [Gaopeijia maritima]|uniref:hypothetical protein n=1 Tax=Gaopeijia maritima TaxID=3119007 RepID=UPI00386AAAFA
MRELPLRLRREPELRDALSDLVRACRTMDDFVDGYRMRNPEVAELADRLGRDGDVTPRR